MVDTLTQPLMRLNPEQGNREIVIKISYTIRAEWLDSGLHFQGGKLPALAASSPCSVTQCRCCDRPPLTLKALVEL